MKNLIICQSPFQVISALILGSQYLEGQDNDIVIMNTFKGAKDLATNLRHLGFFKNVYHFETQTFVYPKKPREQLSKAISVIFPSKLIKKYWGNNIPDYDSIYCWNYESFVTSVRSFFASRGKEVKAFLFDEGYISYFPLEDTNPLGGLMKLAEIRNKVLHRSYANRDHMSGIFLFNPELLLYQPSCPVYQIDRKICQTKEFKSIIDQIFSPQESAKKFSRKYIIFEENQPNVDDLPIFQKIIDTVGAKNVVIKLHPRRTENRFKNLGVSTVADGTPWEAIALTKDFSKHILITIGSGSAVTQRLLLGDQVHSIMLFRIVHPDLPQFSPKYAKFWQKIEAGNPNSGIFIPKNASEFYNYIKQENKK